MQRKLNSIDLWGSIKFFLVLIECNREELVVYILKYSVSVSGTIAASFFTTIYDL